jgi:hypothetical protein
MSTQHSRSVGIAFGALLASSATLVCCVLPAVMVSVGAGAALAGLVSAAPQLVWLSERKAAVFATAAVALMVSGLVLWKARSLPCPADPSLARACIRLRRTSHVLYILAVAAYGLGAAFAFVLPWLSAVYP